jgi:hypothetical protein
MSIVTEVRRIASSNMMMESWEREDLREAASRIEALEKTLKDIAAICTPPHDPSRVVWNARFIAMNAVDPPKSWSIFDGPDLIGWYETKDEAWAEMREIASDGLSMDGIYLHDDSPGGKAYSIEDDPQREEES